MQTNSGIQKPPVQKIAKLTAEERAVNDAIKSKQRNLKRKARSIAKKFQAHQENLLLQLGQVENQEADDESNDRTQNLVTLLVILSYL